MADTISVKSTAHMAILIAEPMPDEFRDKPGLAPPLKSTILNGATHEGHGITHGVDAALFKAWHEAQTKAGHAVAKLVSIVEPDHKEEPVSYGHEPGLEKLAADGDNAKLASEGSRIKEPGPVSSRGMAATSDTPPDDTPRGDPDTVPVARAQEPATAQVEEKPGDAASPRKAPKSP